MKRWWLVIALLLSLGVNVGILATLALSGGGDRAAVEEGPRSDLPPPGRPHDGPPGGPGGGPPGAGSPRGPGAGPPPLSEIAERRLERLASELGLDGAERERFLEIQHGLLADGARLARERFRLQAELRRELLADEPDRERIGRLIGEIAAVFTRLEESTATAILDTRELLDPEQERRYLEVASRIRPRLLRQAEQTMRRRFAERRRRAAPPQP